jgi:hypothetical protein
LKEPEKTTVDMSFIMENDIESEMQEYHRNTNLLGELLETDLFGSCE